MFGVNYQAGGRFDFPFFPTKTKPYIAGIRVQITSSYVESEYIVEQDMEFITMSIGASKYTDKDYWSLEVNGSTIIDHVYTKDVPEGFYFMVVQEVKQGDIIKYKFFNDSGTAKTTWLNFQFLKD